MSPEGGLRHLDLGTRRDLLSVESPYEITPAMLRSTGYICSVAAE